MAGILQQVMGRTVFHYGSINVGGYLETIVARNVDVSTAREGVLLARLHAANVAGGSGGYPQLNIYARPESPAPDDPSLDMVAVNAPNNYLPPSTTGYNGALNVANAEFLWGASPLIPTSVIPSSSFGAVLVAAPINFSSSILGNFGSGLRIIIAAAQPSAPATAWTTFDVTLSIALSLKS